MLFLSRNPRHSTLLKMQKSHHHIGHLHAGVIDVILYIHLLPGGAQQAHKRVAQNGVAQVADVRGLVGIDAGVLDQGMNRVPHPHDVFAFVARVGD